MITYFVFGALFGLVLMCICCILLLDVLKIGILRVDKSDPYDGPHLFLELNKGVSDVVRRKYVLLKVRDEDLVSRQ